MNNRIGIALGGMLMITSAGLHADDGWRHEIAPYVWGAAMEGSAAVRGVDAHVDMSFGDILDHLELGFMGMYRASKDQLSFGVDVVYMGLGEHGRGPRGFASADIDVDQIAVAFDAGYAMSDQLTLLGGLRYNDVSVDLDVNGPLGEHRRAKGDEQWLDPYLGASYRIPFNDQWSATLRGDIGGFGIGSDFAWQAQAVLRWQATPTFGLLAAYRYFDMDYEKDRFKYDMATSGPALGVVFTFE
jgi:hypothetical protein